MARAQNYRVTGDLLVLLQEDDVPHLDRLALHLTIAPLLDHSDDPLVSSIILLVPGE